MLLLRLIIAILCLVVAITGIDFMQIMSAKAAKDLSLDLSNKK